MGREPLRAERFDLDDPEAVAFCVDCAAPFARRVERCVTCGSEDVVSRETLIARLESEEQAPGMTDPVELVRLSTEDEADLVRGALAEAGIAWAEFAPETKGMLFPPVGPTIRLYVERADLERAQEALTVLDEPEFDEDSP
ncbi:MAG: hypothetical protein D6738_02755 [Acidobacteria bacterium]|nr:MAG: hypothetical protein D6738_02755 [Acidobacteriota bacterium]